MRLKTDTTVAVALPQPIGDSLIGFVLVNNLVRNNYKPVVFGWVAEQLADWLPAVHVARIAPRDMHGRARSIPSSNCVRPTTREAS